MQFPFFSFVRSVEGASFDGSGRGQAALIALTLMLLFFTLSVQAQTAQTSESIIAQARALILEEDPQAAFELLQAEETQLAGDLDFDYWLGLAAVRADLPSQALFPLERVIAQYPAHAGARMELATAYLQLGLNDAAAEELDIMETLEPPPEAAKRMAQMRAVISGRAPRGEKAYMAYITLEGGLDDNPGTWPDLEEIFGISGINPDNTVFGQLQAGYQHRFKPGRNQGINLALSGMSRKNQEEDASQFDMDFAQGQIDWETAIGRSSALALGAELGQLWLDGEDYRTQAGGWLELRKQLGDRTRIRLRGAARDFAFELDDFDYTQNQLTLGITRLRSARSSFELTAGAEQESAEDRPGGDARRASLQLRSVRQLFSRHQLSWDLRYQRTEYDQDYEPGEAVNNTAAVSREDDTLIAGLQWDWRSLGAWHVRARGQYRYQESTLDLFSHEQRVISAALTRYF